MPAETIICVFPFWYSPREYFGKNFLSGERIPPTIGNLIIPPCICPLTTKSAPHAEYVSRQLGLCAIIRLKPFFKSPASAFS